MFWRSLTVLAVAICLISCHDTLYIGHPNASFEHVQYVRLTKGDSVLLITHRTDDTLPLCGTDSYRDLDLSELPWQIVHAFTDTTITLKAIDHFIHDTLTSHARDSLREVNKTYYKKYWRGPFLYDMIFQGTVTYSYDSALFVNAIPVFTELSTYHLSQVQKIGVIWNFNECKGLYWHLFRPIFKPGALSERHFLRVHIGGAHVSAQRRTREYRLRWPD